MIKEIWRKITWNKCEKCGQRTIPFFSDMLDGIKNMPIWICRNCKTEWI